MITASVSDTLGDIGFVQHLVLFLSKAWERLTTLNKVPGGSQFEVDVFRFFLVAVLINVFLLTFVWFWYKKNISELLLRTGSSRQPSPSETVNPVIDQHLKRD